MLARLHAGLERARDQAREAVLSPDDGKRADVIYVEAYADLLYRTTGLHADAERLLEALAESSPPASPLEAVLADIEAEGHKSITLSGHGGHWYLQSHTASLPYPHGGDYAAQDQWALDVEQAHRSGEDALELCERRLAEIRDLHINKLAAVRWVVEMFDVDRLRLAVEPDPGQAIADAQDAAGAEEEPF